MYTYINKQLYIYIYIYIHLYMATGSMKAQLQA